MAKTFKRRMLLWMWNGCNAALGGLATGVTTALGIDTVNKVVPGLSIPVSFHQFLVICFVSSAVSLAMFVRSNQLPPLDTADGTIPIPTPAVTTTTTTTTGTTE